MYVLLIQLTIPIERFYGSHLRLEFRHCSSEYYTNKFCENHSYHLVSFSSLFMHETKVYTVIFVCTEMSSELFELPQKLIHFHSA